MADHKEYEIRKKRMETDPCYANYKEGYYRSPSGKLIYSVVSYEAQMINVTEVGSQWSTSIYPICWDLLMSDWEYLGKDLGKSPVVPY